MSDEAGIVTATLTATTTTTTTAEHHAGRPASWATTESR